MAALLLLRGQRALASSPSRVAKSRGLVAQLWRLPTWRCPTSPGKPKGRDQVAARWFGLGVEPLVLEEERWWVSPGS